VIYRCGLASYSEWICFEHGGRPTRKAIEWWRQRDDLQDPPETTAEALARTPVLRKPSRILVDLAPKFSRILQYDFDTGMSGNMDLPFLYNPVLPADV
jgi:DNA repair protein RadD